MTGATESASAVPGDTLHGETLRPTGPPALRLARRPWLRTATVAAVVLLGSALHLWYLFHLPLNSDQAVAGLMARQMLHGHFSAFYWEQVYGGSAEEIVVAAFGGVFGFTALSVNGSIAFLFAVAAVLTWRAARRLVADPWLAAMAGALVWTVPLAEVSNGTYAYGFRGVTMVCGVGVILVALRVLDGHHSWWEFGALGLLAGLGWWSSPEIVYFLVPAGILLAQTGRQSPRPPTGWWVRRMAVAVGGFGFATWPWVWANVSSGFASLKSSNYGTTTGHSGLHAVLGRLDLYPKYVLPMTFGLRQQWTGAWLGGRLVGIALYLLATVLLIGTLAVCVAMTGRGLAIAIGVIAFPFLLAVSPASSAWQSGRYFVYDIPLIAMVLAVAAARVGGLAPARLLPLHSKRGTGQVGRVAISLAALGLCAAALVDLRSVTRNPGTKWWSNPDAPTLASVRSLEAAGVTVGYADYWVAYRLDLLSGEKLRLTVGGTDPVRDRAVDRQVRTAPAAAWVFVPPTQLAFSQFGLTARIQGPNGIGEATLLHALGQAHIPYRTVQAGMVNAVIPAAPFSPEMLTSSQ